jgi:hypothetical protein
LKKQSEEEMYVEVNASVRSEDHDPIKRFSEKIDKLLDALNQVYFFHIVLFICVIDYLF